jgi:transposase
MAALLSLMQTCRAMGIAPQAYLEDLFRQLLDHPHQRHADLLPDRWQAARTSTAQA